MSATKKLFIMRHAESLEDIDKTAYERISDEDMPLTDFGKEQANQFGIEFASQINTCKNLRIFLSPSKRVLQTVQIIVSTLPEKVKWSLFTENLIVKQDWGNVTIFNRAQIEKERYSVGVLRYNFPEGESGVEMLFRFGLFVKKLTGELAKDTVENVLVVTHGFELRVLLKSLLGWTEEYFETLAHPYHCEMKRVLYNNGSFILLDEMRGHTLTNESNFIKRRNA